MRLTLIVSMVLLRAGVAEQTPSAPAFEAASVKPSILDSRVRPTMQGGPGTGDEGQITYRNATLLNLLLRAYNVQAYQVSGPDWLGVRRYEVLAKIPPGTSADQFRSMLRNLLVERFGLVLHHSRREFAGYELVVAKNRPKLAPATPGPDAGMTLMEGVHGHSVVTGLTARAQPIAALVEMLGKEFRTPIVDRTGLEGNFDFRLEFAPQPPGALPSASPDHQLDSADDSAPNLITAVQQQIGLKLNPVKIPLDVLIVDRANPVPVEN